MSNKLKWTLSAVIVLTVVCGIYATIQTSEPPVTTSSPDTTKTTQSKSLNSPPPADKAEIPIATISGKDLVLDGSFEEPFDKYSVKFKNKVKPAWKIHIDNDQVGSVTRNKEAALYGERGVRLYRKGGKAKKRGRAELYALSIPDVKIGEERWTAFSFKIEDAGAILAGMPATIFQYWTWKGLGPKTQFYLNADDQGQLSINLHQTTRCTYKQSKGYLRPDGSQICEPSKLRKHKSNGNKFLKEKFNSINIKQGQWYQIRLRIIGDAPLPSLPEKYTVKGEVEAEIREHLGDWQNFTLFTDSNKTVLQAFTHERHRKDSDRRGRNIIQFGYYGRAERGKEGIIYFDAMSSARNKKDLFSPYTK